MWKLKKTDQRKQLTWIFSVKNPKGQKNTKPSLGFSALAEASGRVTVQRLYVGRDAEPPPLPDLKKHQHQQGFFSR
jgi:hypothetical protein